MNFQASQISNPKIFVENIKKAKRIFLHRKKEVAKIVTGVNPAIC